MVPDLLSVDRPALHSVALLAVRSHLPAVYVTLLVAVSAILPDAFEHGLDVARRTLHLLVHPPKRVVRFVVIKLRHRADRTPGGCRVAVFTWDRQRAVRITGSLILRVGIPRDAGRGGGRYCGSSSGKEQSGPQREMEEGNRKVLRSAAGVAVSTKINLDVISSAQALFGLKQANSTVPWDGSRTAGRRLNGGR